MSDGAQLHRSFLAWGDFRYARISLLLCALAIAVYALYQPIGTPNGGTTLGYTLGVMAGLLVAWLAWFGIRRRRYGGADGLTELLSAHVYLGCAVALIALLHAGFHLHANVHTLALVLLLAVVGSGVFGAYAFWRMPDLMTENRAGLTLGRMAALLAELDLTSRTLALAFPDDIVTAVGSATEAPPITSTLRELATGAQRRAARARGMAAIARVQAELLDGQGATPGEVLPLVRSLTQRVTLADRMYKDWRFRVLLLQWRAIHVPLTIALLAALTIHIVAVFYTW